MTNKELVERYLELKAKGKIDLSGIKKELKEKHNLSQDEVSFLVNEIADEELKATKNFSEKNYLLIISFLAFGIFAFAYSCYGILNPTGKESTDLLAYASLFGGIYIIYRNIKKLRY